MKPADIQKIRSRWKNENINEKAPGATALLLDYQTYTDPVRKKSVQISNCDRYYREGKLQNGSFISDGKLRQVAA